MRRFVYTPVDVDGTLAGPDIEGLRAVAEAAADHGAELIYSGGIGDLEHLRALADAQLPALERGNRRTGALRAPVHRRRGPRGAPRRRAVAASRRVRPMNRATHGLLMVGIGGALALGVATSLWPESRVPEPAQPQAEPRPALPYFGFNEAAWGTAWQGQALNDAIAAAAEAGANTNRLTVRWFDVVGPSGAWDEDGWARYRTAYQTMLLAGIQPIVMLVAAPRGTDQLGDPDWAAPGCLAGGASPPAPEYDQRWTEFVARAGLEFGGALAFQIWNEPNSEEYWGGCDVDPARYVQLVDLARRALGPSERMPIVSAGLNSAVDEPAGMPWTDVPAAGALRGTADRRQSAVRGRAPVPAPGHLWRDPGGDGPRAGGRDEPAARRGRAPESGGDLGDGVRRRLRRPPCPTECRALGPELQAQVLTAMYDLLARDDRVEVGIVHQLVDQAVANPDPSVVGLLEQLRRDDERNVRERVPGPQGRLLVPRRAPGSAQPLDRFVHPRREPRIGLR